MPEDSAAKKEEEQEKLLNKILEVLASTSSKKISTETNILKDLSNLEDNKDTEYELVIDLLGKLYEDSNYRHPYTIVSRFIIKKKNDLLKTKNIDGVGNKIEEALLQSIASKIEMVYIRARAGGGFAHMEKLFKLRDHINLEIARITDNTRVQLALEEKIMQAKTSLNEFSATSKNIQRDYITILGIFAAIILTFVSGLVFSNSVLQNIDKASIYKLLLISIIIGFFITNILLFLFNFVKSITRNNENNSVLDPHISYFNLAAIILILVLFAVSVSHESIYKKYDSNSTINVNTANISFSSNR
ncbi:hypothetical protein [Campylobacter concisus]|uniref:hypothetical protein n=1 Tax=Campylobacter concisus TaxID=199 RepID=UPI000D312F8D|nr:hypothetical protein [Campylobacter concisus]